jgi:hypothetical protein
MTDTSYRFQVAATEMDAHLRDCPTCAAGHACPAGDDTAEREYRAWRAYRDDPTTSARTTRRRGCS